MPRKRPLTRAKLSALKRKVETVMAPVPEATEELSLTTLYDVGREIEQELPGIARRLMDDARDPKTSPKDRLSIFKEFSTFVLASERLAKDMGLVRKDAEANDAAGLLRRVFGKSLSELRLLPPDEVDALLEATEGDDGVYRVG